MALLLVLIAAHVIAAAIFHKLTNPLLSLSLALSPFHCRALRLHSSQPAVDVETSATSPNNPNLVDSFERFSSDGTFKRASLFKNFCFFVQDIDASFLFPIA
jgi:hypothetical protein